MADFAPALNITLALHEGGYANDLNDPGKETYAGISRSHWPDWEGWPIIDSSKPLRPGQIVHGNPDLDGLIARFYDVSFWRPMRAGEIINQVLAAAYFDMAVNRGQGAARALQQSCLDCGRSIAQDGVVGNATIGAVNQCEPVSFLEHFKQRWLDQYLEIVRRNPAMLEYLGTEEVPGPWRRRINDYVL